VNLHQIASGVISAVNPMQQVTLRASTGYATGADGKRTPSYGPPTPLSGQVQELSTKDLWHLESLNLAGSSRKIYLNGEVNAIVRVKREGGDLITLRDGTVWLTTRVLEQFPEWVSVAVTLQD